MNRVAFREHRGVRYLELDFTHMTELLPVQETCAAAHAAIRREPLGSVRTLTNVTGSHFNKPIVAAMRQLAVDNKPYVRAAAIVGLTGLMKVVYNAIVRLTGRNIVAFDHVDPAREYLAREV